MFDYISHHDSRKRVVLETGAYAQGWERSGLTLQVPALNVKKKQKKKHSTPLPISPDTPLSTSVD